MNDLHKNSSKRTQVSYMLKSIVNPEMVKLHYYDEDGQPSSTIDEYIDVLLAVIEEHINRLSLSFGPEDLRAMDWISDLKKLVNMSVTTKVDLQQWEKQFKKVSTKMMMNINDIELI